NTRDQLSGPQRELLVGMVAGQQVQIADGDLAFASRTADADHGVERVQRHAHVRGVRRDALVADAEDGMHPGPAVHRVATGPGLTLVAARSEVPVVRATRPLEQFAADGRRVSKLWRSARKKRLGQAWRRTAHVPVLRDGSIGGESTDLESSIADLDLPEVEPRDIDDALRIEHLDLHQVDEIRAAREKSRPGTRCDGIVDAAGPLEGEEAH